jgi:dTDP-glucose 4,6-dehydratase
VSITRCSNNYGPYQHPEKLIPLFITNLFNGLQVPLYGDGSNVREWLHVSDHCRAIQLVLTSGRSGEIYNVGGGNERTNLQITEALLDLCSAGPALVKRVADRLGHDQRYALDDSKIRAELGYEPQVSFEQGLADTVAWYRDHPAWWKPLRDFTA